MPPQTSSEALLAPYIKHAVTSYYVLNSSTNLHTYPEDSYVLLLFFVSSFLPNVWYAHTIFMVSCILCLSSSEDEEEDNDKENMDPSTQNNDVHTREHLQRAIGGDSCTGDAIIKDFLDDEAEEEDDSDNDMMRFKDNEEDDGSDENEVFNDLIAAGYEEKEVDHEKRNELHQKWLEQQDAAETNNVMQRLKFGHQEQKASAYEDEDEDKDEDVEDCEEGSQNEDLTPANVVRQNSEKAKQMIAKMFEDDNDTYEHSDDEEIEEHLARQRISKREVSTTP